MPISLHCHILHEKHIVIALLTKHSIVHLVSLGIQLITNALQQSKYPGAKLNCKVLHRSIAKFQRQCPCKRVSIYQCIVYIHCASSIIAPMFWCALAVHQYIAIKNHCIHILTEMDVMILPVWCTWFTTQMHCNTWATQDHILFNIMVLWT